MASIAALTETFEGTAGNDVTTSNTGADSLTGSGTAKFNADSAVGSTSVEVVGSASNRLMRFDFTSQADIFLDFIVKLTALDSANTVAIANWYDSAGSGTGKIGDLRVGYVNATTYTLQLRDNNTGVWTSSNLTTNAWYRVQLEIDPGSATGHRCYIYNTISSDTADQDSGDQAATANSQTAVDNVRLGTASSSTMTIRFDDMRADDTSLVSRASGVSADASIASTWTITASGSVGTTDSLFVKVSGSWVTVTEKVRSSGSWV